MWSYSCSVHLSWEDGTTVVLFNLDLICALLLSSNVMTSFKSSPEYKILDILLALSKVFFSVLTGSTLIGCNVGILPVNS